jgi:peptidoglycan hydrolase-like protein with peptidoglycan-binding domain
MSKPTYEELEAQLAETQAELEEKTDQPATPQASADVAPADGAEEVVDGTIVAEPAETGGTVAEPTGPTSLPGTWPSKGYTGPQPWEVDEPPALGHREGLLLVGSAGDDVRTLCALLAYAGYPTDVAEGKDNPLSVFDASVKAAVESFRRDYGIKEDPAIIAASTNDVAGPWTWAALYRIARRRAA